MMMMMMMMMMGLEGAPLGENPRGITCSVHREVAAVIPKP
jgi:hypothetical protein